MSSWSYVLGTIKVVGVGRTDEEMEFMLKTTLNHLPRVTGSEGDMQVFLNKSNSIICRTFSDEFGNKSNLSKSFETHDMFLITVYGSLRDRDFERTLREFSKWFYRLASRTNICDYCIHIQCYDRHYTMTGDRYVKEFPYVGTDSEFIRKIMPSYYNDDEDNCQPFTIENPFN